MSYSVQKKIEVSKLQLDPENPRFFQLRELKGRKNLSQDELITEIGNDTEIPTLLKGIKRSGVKDPIWVKPLNGKYLVIEGNRRTYILKRLVDERATPPDGVQYDQVCANVFNKNVSDTELLLQRVRLQAGKKAWGAFNEAVATYDLRYKYNLEEEDIAAELQKSIKWVKDTIDNYQLFLDYVKATKQGDPKKFSFFSDSCPKEVKEWISASVDNKKTYYDLITPKKDGVQKIRSVATRGGLRDFKEIIDRPKVLKKFIKDKDMTVEDALDEVKEQDLLVAVPFLTKLGSTADKLCALTEEQIEMLSDDQKVLRDVKRLYKACSSILTKLGQNA